MDYLARRQRLGAELGPGAAACLANPPLRARNGSNEYRYRADSNVLYFTPLEEPESVVVLLPPGHPTPFVVFVPPRDLERERWTGPRLGVEGARERLGADRAYPLSDFETVAAELLEPLDELFLPFMGSEGLFASCQRVIARLRQRRGKPAGGPRKLADLNLVMARLRSVKSADEIAAMQRSADVATAAMFAAAAAIGPGRPEHAVEAAILAVLREHDAQPAFETIVGAGVNATYLHYFANSAVMRSGQSVLVDLGGELGGYASDITRCLPVDAHFTPSARVVYEIVLAAQQAAFAAVRAGASVRAPHHAAVRVVVEGLVALGVLQGEVDALCASEAHRPYFPHSTSHYLGIDAHDPGVYWERDGSEALLQANMVLTVEPGLYLPHDDEKVPPALRGLGMRLEDDVVVGVEGAQVLTSAFPRVVDEVEAACAQMRGGGSRQSHAVVHEARRQAGERP